MRTLLNVTQSFDANVYFEYRWNDSRLVHKNNDVISAKLAEIWDPRILIVNQQKIFSTLPDIVKKILEHLGLWLVKSKPPPRANGPPGELYIDYSDSQIPPFDDYPCTDILYPEAF